MRYRNFAIAALAAFAVFRVLYILFTPLAISPDEAHYWEWSRRLGLSYYSKGPGVAYVIAFFTSIFGDNAFGIRIGAVAFSTLGGWFVYLLGKEVFESEKTGFYAMLLMELTPIFAVGAVLMTTDVLLVTFWAGAVWCVNRAVGGRRGGWWYLAGLMIGLGFLSKYTMFFLVLCIPMFLLFSKNERFWLRRREPYVAGLISLVAVTPVIYWNIRNGQVTIMHTIGQVNAAGGLTMFLEFLGSQAALLTPLVFIAAVWGAARCASIGFRSKRSGLQLLFFASAPLFLFFLFKSLHGKVQANWAVASYITAYPAAVWAYSGLSGGAGRKPERFKKAIAWAAFGFCFAISFLAYFPWALEAMGVEDIFYHPPYNRVVGWEELGERVSEVRAEMGLESGRVFIASDSYQITSELALYTEGNPTVYNFNTGGRRMNQYDLWPGYNGLTGYNALYVKGGTAEIEPLVEASFESCAREVFFIHRGERVMTDFTFFRCYGFKGFDAGADMTY